MDGGSTFPTLRPSRRALQIDPVQPVARSEHFRDLAGDLACALDPVAFAVAAGVMPDPWQASVLRSPARQLLLNCSRQSGKSTTVAALAVHAAVYTPGSLILVFAPGLRQSIELFRKIMAFYRVAGTVDPDQESSQRIELPNGSRILALPGTPDHVRGFSAPAMVIVDECAFVPDELIYAVMPMLAVSGGRFIGLSTPNGKQGWFHGTWTNDDPGWSRVMVPASMCPRIPATFLEEQRRSMPAHKFRAEFECEFTDLEDNVFASDLLRAAVTPDLSPVMPGFSW